MSRKIEFECTLDRHEKACQEYLTVHDIPKVEGIYIKMENRLEGKVLSSVLISREDSLKLADFLLRQRVITGRDI